MPTPLTEDPVLVEAVARRYYDMFYEGLEPDRRVEWDKCHVGVRETFCKRVIEYLDAFHAEMAARGQAEKIPGGVLKPEDNPLSFTAHPEHFTWRIEVGRGDILYRVPAPRSGGSR